MDVELEDISLEVTDLGDAVEETKQHSPFGSWPDCLFDFGSRPGC